MKKCCIFFENLLQKSKTRRIFVPVIKTHSNMKEYKITVFGNPTCLVNRRTYPLIKKLADGKIKFTGSCVWNCNKTKASTFTKEEAEEMVEKLNTLSNMAEHWRKERFDFTIEEW